MKMLCLAAALPIAAFFSAFGAGAPNPTAEALAREAASAQEPAALEPFAWLRPAYRIVVPSPKAEAGRLCPKLSFMALSVSATLREADNVPDVVNLLKRKLGMQTTTLRALDIDEDLRLLLGPPRGDGPPGEFDLTVGREFGPDHLLQYGINTDPRGEVIYILNPETGQCICQKGDGLTLGGQNVYLATDDGGLIQLMGQIEINLSQLPMPDPPEEDR